MAQQGSDTHAWHSKALTHTHVYHRGSYKQNTPVYCRGLRRRSLSLSSFVDVETTSFSPPNRPGPARVEHAPAGTTASYYALPGSQTSSQSPRGSAAYYALPGSQPSSGGVLPPGFPQGSTQTQSAAYYALPGSHGNTQTPAAPPKGNAQAQGEAYFALPGSQGSGPGASYYALPGSQPGSQRGSIASVDVQWPQEPQSRSVQGITPATAAPLTTTNATATTVTRARSSEPRIVPSLDNPGKKDSDGYLRQLSQTAAYSDGVADNDSATGRSSDPHAVYVHLDSLASKSVPAPMGSSSVPNLDTTGGQEYVDLRLLSQTVTRSDSDSDTEVVVARMSSIGAQSAASGSSYSSHHGHDASPLRWNPPLDHTGTKLRSSSQTSNAHHNARSSATSQVSQASRTSQTSHRSHASRTSNNDGFKANLQEFDAKLQQSNDHSSVADATASTTGRPKRRDSFVSVTDEDRAFVQSRAPTVHNDSNSGGSTSRRTYGSQPSIASTTSTEASYVDLSVAGLSKQPHARLPGQDARQGSDSSPAAPTDAGRSVNGAAISASRVPQEASYYALPGSQQGVPLHVVGVSIPATHGQAAVNMVSAAHAPAGSTTPLATTTEAAAASDTGDPNPSAEQPHALPNIATPRTSSGTKRAKTVTHI